jgi:hypothetical protein
MIVKGLKYLTAKYVEWQLTLGDQRANDRGVQGDNDERKKKLKFVFLFLDLFFVCVEEDTRSAKSGVGFQCSQKYSRSNINCERWASVTGELDIQEAPLLVSMGYLQARAYIPEPRSKIYQYWLVFKRICIYIYIYI